MILDVVWMNNSQEFVPVELIRAALELKKDLEDLDRKQDSRGEDNID